MTDHEALMAIAGAAADYLHECNNPSPDLSYRIHLRHQLAASIDNAPIEVQRAIGWRA